MSCWHWLTQLLKTTFSGEINSFKGSLFLLQQNVQESIHKNWYFVSLSLSFLKLDHEILVRQKNIFCMKRVTFLLNWFSLHVLNWYSAYAAASAKINKGSTDVTIMLDRCITSASMIGRIMIKMATPKHHAAKAYRESVVKLHTFSITCVWGMLVSELPNPSMLDNTWVSLRGNVTSQNFLFWVLETHLDLVLVSWLGESHFTQNEAESIIITTTIIFIITGHCDLFLWIQRWSLSLCHCFGCAKSHLHLTK